MTKKEKSTICLFCTVLFLSWDWPAQTGANNFTLQGNSRANTIKFTVTLVAAFSAWHQHNILQLSIFFETITINPPIYNLKSSSTFHSPISMQCSPWSAARSGPSVQSCRASALVPPWWNFLSLCRNQRREAGRHPRSRGSTGSFQEIHCHWTSGYILQGSNGHMKFYSRTLHVF